MDTKSPAITIYLYPTDYHLFKYMKQFLAGKNFNDDNFRNTIRNFVNSKNIDLKKICHLHLCTSLEQMWMEHILNNTKCSLLQVINFSY